MNTQSMISEVVDTASLRALARHIYAEEATWATVPAVVGRVVDIAVERGLAVERGPLARDITAALLAVEKDHHPCSFCGADTGIAFVRLGEKQPGAADAHQAVYCAGVAACRASLSPERRAALVAEARYALSRPEDLNNGDGAAEAIARFE